MHYLRPRRPSPTIVHFSTPIDQVAASRAFDELREPTLQVHDQGLADRERWTRVYSDHFPVTVDVDASRDRDPAATFRPADARHALQPLPPMAAVRAVAASQPTGAAPPPAAAAPATEVERAPARAVADVSSLPEAPLQDAQTPAAPARGARVPASPIPVGSRVELRLIGGDAFTGTLLQPLGGSWVWLQVEGRPLAAPVGAVAFVRGL